MSIPDGAPSDAELFDGVLYLAVSNDERSWIEALDARCGQQLWATDLQSDVYPSMSVREEVILLAATTPQDETSLWGLDRADGAVRWSSAVPVSGVRFETDWLPSLLSHSPMPRVMEFAAIEDDGSIAVARTGEVAGRPSTRSPCSTRAR